MKEIFGKNLQITLELMFIVNQQETKIYFLKLPK